MAITKYSLNNTQTPETIGSREYSSPGSNSFVTTTTPTGLAKAMTGHCNFMDASVSPHSSPGSFQEFFFEKKAGKGVILETIFMVDWGYFTGYLVVKPDGACGTGAAAGSGYALSTMSLNPGYLSEGAIPDGWHRCMIRHEPAAQTTTQHWCYFYLGANKYSSTPSTGLATWDSYSAPVSNNPDALTGLLSLGNASGGIYADAENVFSDLHYGLLTDTPVVRSPGVTTKNRAGIIQI